VQAQANSEQKGDFQTVHFQYHHAADFGKIGVVVASIVKVLAASNMAVTHAVDIQLCHK
jgi:hypothetical protein